MVEHEHKASSGEGVSYEHTSTPQREFEHPFFSKGEESENFGFEILKIVVLAIVIVLPIRIFIAQPFVVSGDSMYPTFENGEYLVVDQLDYRINEPQRGDVIIFRFPLEPSKFFIKRIIGLPGETVILQGKAIIVVNNEYPEGFVVDEKYLSSDNTLEGTGNFPLDTDSYFVMGDNRGESFDSRSWGALPKENIIGRALVRLFPITHIGIFPGK